MLRLSRAGQQGVSRSGYPGAADPRNRLVPDAFLTVPSVRYTPIPCTNFAFAAQADSRNDRSVPVET